MIKTTENKRNAPKILTLIVCLGALTILYGATGCSTSNPDSYAQQQRSDTLATTTDLLHTGPLTHRYWGTGAYGVGYGINGEAWDIESFE